MKRIYAREEYCVGCKLCEIFCVVGHSKSKDIIKTYKKEQDRPAPRVAVWEDGPLSFAFQCRHCDQPACVEACITGALSKNEEGTVLCNEDKCVGCWTCITVCPFGAIQRGGGEKKKIVKCNLCSGEPEPYCVSHCPNRAIVYEERGVE